jgi:hypothetical protein
MSIYDIPEETRDEKLRNLMRGIASSKNVIQHLDGQHRGAFNQIWNNEEFTPQEIMDAYGTNAAKLFIDSSATQNFLAVVLEGYVPLVPPQPFTINQDGTVTIGA